jgi:hypothetical protein
MVDNLPQPQCSNCVSKNITCVLNQQHFARKNPSASGGAIRPGPGDQTRGTGSLRLTPIRPPVGAFGPSSDQPPSPQRPGVVPAAAVSTSAPLKVDPVYYKQNVTSQSRYDLIRKCKIVPSVLSVTDHGADLLFWITWKGKHCVSIQIAPVCLRGRVMRN